MSLIQEFKEYSNIMLARKKHETLSNINHFKLGFCNTLISNNYLSNE